MTNQQPSEALPITKMLEERKILLELTSRQTVFEGLDFRQSISEIEQIIPQVRQLETEEREKLAVSIDIACKNASDRARSQEKERILGILEEFFYNIVEYKPKDWDVDDCIEHRKILLKIIESINNQ